MKAHHGPFRRTREASSAVTHDTAIARQQTAADAIPGYRLLQPIGRGGMGEVHQAVQLSLGRTVAVKLLRAELAHDEQFVGRFEKEGAALGTLRHPNIVSIVDRGKAGETYYLVMEYVDGRSLRERMREPDFDATKALITMLQVTRAVDYAHHRGVIHRDLKPENILFDEQAGDLPKVTDFGLAGFDERHVNTPRNLTQTHVAMGTASYMAPEQSVDARSAGPRADLYALGVILYELLTGELPLGSFALPSVKKPGVDKRFDAIVSRCLKPSPDDRYPSAAALLEDLEQLAPSFATGFNSSRQLTPLQRVTYRALQVWGRVWRALALVTVLFAIAVLAAQFWRASEADARTPAGVELTTDFGVRTLLSSPGRVDKATHVVSLGDGPDTISVQALGRRPKVEKGALVYESPDSVAAGRAVIDAPLDGDGLEYAVSVDTLAAPPSRLEPLWGLFRGPRHEARSALLLLGEHGRYVALVLSGSGAEPTLEWALGPDKRGNLRAPLPTSTRGQRLALRIDPEVGQLFAVVGEGRDARVLGEGLWLGPRWREALGASPRMALGCLEGGCTFRRIEASGLELPAGLSPPPFPLEEGEVLPATVSGAQKLKEGEGPRRPGRTGGTTAKPPAAHRPEAHPATTAPPRKK
jgi:eukaryotic-like serine/threonine-protein kinase